MNVTEKIKAILNLHKLKVTDLADFFGTTRQGMSNKLSRGYFTATDLIKIAEFVDAELFYELKNGHRIYLRKKTD